LRPWCADRVDRRRRAARCVGFGHGIAWYEYFYSQAWAISALQLTLWPDRLAFDWREPDSRPARRPGLDRSVVGGTATAVAWKRAPWIAFRTWFFMLLAPSSSIVPIQTEIAAERRV
jgi:hypothetical protein